MAELADIIKVIQLRTGIEEKAYTGHIESVIGVIWAEIANSGMFWFLKHPEAKSISLAVGQDVYDISQVGLGRMLMIADVNGRRVFTYKKRRHFDKAVAGSGTVGAASVFTDLGIVKNNIRRIRLDLTPATADTVYLWWQEAGTLANLNKLPVSGTRALIHGVMSLIAPPVMMREQPLKWQAVTFKEAQLYQAALNEFIHNEAFAEDEEYEMELDSLEESRLTEINNL